MKKIKIGIIGVGQIGQQHLDNYSKLEGVEVIAACDIDPTHLNSIADKYHIPNRYNDFRELLKRDDIDAVDVCLHNNFHSKVTIEALAAGKHVYCEKPIAGSYVDGKAMVSAAKQYGRMLHIQLGTLYTKETKAAKELIDAGELGKIYHSRSTGFRRRNRPYVDGYATKNFVNKDIAAGGALIDMGIYHISQLLYLLGMPTVERISGKVYQEIPMNEKRREESGFNVEELALGFVRFSGGLTMDIIEPWAIMLDTIESSSIVGSNGGLRLSPFSFHKVVCDMDMNATLNLETAEFRKHKLNENEDAYDSSQAHWIAALQGRVELLPTAEIALLTMLISEGIYLSDKLGREVSVQEALEASQSTAVTIN